MQSRLDSPNINAIPGPDQHLMDRAREAAIRARREEQESILQSRKRKLKDLYQVTQAIEWNKHLSSSHGPYAFGSATGESGVDEFEKQFLDLNNLLLGRLYEESSLPRLFAAAITPSKQAVSPVISRKALSLHQSPRSPVKKAVGTQASEPVVETPPEGGQSPTKIIDAAQSTESSVAPLIFEADTGVSNTTSDDGPIESPIDSPVSPKRRKLSNPSSTFPTQDTPGLSPLEIPKEKSSNASVEPTSNAPIVDVFGIPVVQNSRPPVVSTTQTDPTADGVPPESHSTLRPPLSLVKNSLDKEIYPTSGDPAVIEKDVHDSLSKLSKPSPAKVDPTSEKTPDERPFPIIQKQKKSPTASQPQLAVVPPFFPSIQKFSSPISSPSSQDRQNTPSSPITSDDDDDDLDNNAAIISSATSPDASGLLPDESRSDLRNGELLEKRDLLTRMSDPSFQLRLEDELARKDQWEPESKVSDVGGVPTLGPTGRKEVSIVSNGGLAKEQEEVPINHLEEDSEKGVVELINNNHASEPVVSTSSIAAGKEEVVEEDHVRKHSFQSIQSIAVEQQRLLSVKVDESLASREETITTPTVLPLPASEVEEAHNEGQENALVSDVIPQPDIPLPAPEVPSMTAEHDVLCGAVENEDESARMLIGSEKAETEEHSNESNAPLEAHLNDLSAHHDTAAGLESKIAVDHMDVDQQISATEEQESVMADVDSGELLKENSQFVDEQINSQSLGDNSDKVAYDQTAEYTELNLPDAPAGDSTEAPRPSKPSFAVIKALEQKRRKERERSRLARVVFAGETPEDRPQDTKSTTSLLGSHIAKYPQDVASFLSYSTKRQGKPDSVDAPLPPPQVTRQRSSSTAHPHIHGPQFPKKDYLTPYFQLEAFEQPLHQLLHQSHKTVLTSNYQLCIQEQQTKQVYKRIQQLQDKGLWSLRQPVRVREPRRRLCHWDYLIQEANWMSTDFRQERRLKIVQCKMLVDMVMQWHFAEPEERKFLCVDRAEWSRRMKYKGRKRSMHEMSGVEASKQETEIQDEEMVNAVLDEQSLSHTGPDEIDSSQTTENEPKANEERMGPGESEPGWISEDDGDTFDHILTPPVQLFTLGLEETIFEMPPTDFANEILSELPLSVPPTLPVDPSVLDNEVEECWQMQIIPVSKVCVAKMKLNDEGPPRKKSRYEYEENYNLFADDSDAEDSPNSNRRDSSSLGRSGRATQKQPTPLPPESTNVALFNPDFKHILNRMQGHSFKPPSVLPPVAFFENRQASQWLPSEDEKLKDLVQRYPHNWALISTFMTFKGDLQSAPERRSPWECFERYLQIETISPEFAKSPWYKGIQQRLEVASKINAPNSATVAPQNGPGGSGSSTPTIRRRGNAPMRVERRKNTKVVALVESMKKLAKRRELTQTKQQNAAGVANRKAEQQSQNKPKLQGFVPAHFSKMKHDREMKIERQARENAALVAQQRAALQMRSHPGQPHAFANGVSINVQHAAQQPRNGTPAVNSPVVASSNANGLSQGAPGIPVLRASPSVAQALPNGVVPASGGAPVPGMAGIPHTAAPGAQTQVNGAAAANAMALGLRPHVTVPGSMHRNQYTQEQIQQILRMKAHQQQQMAAAQAAAAAHQGQNGSNQVGMGGVPINFSQHAIIAAQQQALNAASAGGLKQHHTNGVGGDNNLQNGISPQQRPQMNIAGQAGSPRLHQPQQMLHGVPPSPQILSQWIQRNHPGISPAEIQKMTEQRLSDYHHQIRQQLTNINVQAGAGFPAGINGGMTVQQQQLYQQQQALRQQQHLLAQQQRQGSQGPAQMQQSTVVGGVVSRGTTPQQNQNLLQRSASMQSVGHPLQRTQSIGQQGHQQAQQQSPRQSQVQQAQMAGIPQPQQSSPPQP